ncbi:hypothetical protein WJX74_007683 [Apatococcus lobatus]|uniref:Uncharacterized protein n=1 Tax=Apatococcus lobatus TaxID=904363 RepID=A0AAW1RSJ8_9CHLO
MLSSRDQGDSSGLTGIASRPQSPLAREMELPDPVIRVKLPEYSKSQALELFLSFLKTCPDFQSTAEILELELQLAARTKLAYDGNLQAELQQHIQTCSLQLHSRLQGPSGVTQLRLESGSSAPLALTSHAHASEPRFPQPEPACAADVEACIGPRSTVAAAQEAKACILPSSAAHALPMDVASVDGAAGDPAQGAAAPALEAPMSSPFPAQARSASILEPAAAAGSGAAYETSAAATDPATEQDQGPLLAPIVAATDPPSSENPPPHLVKTAASMKPSEPTMSNEPAALVAPVPSAGHDNPLQELLDWDFEEEPEALVTAASPGPRLVRSERRPHPSDKDRAGSTAGKPQSLPQVPASKRLRPPGDDVKPVGGQHRADEQPRHGLAAAEQRRQGEARDRRRASSRSPGEAAAAADRRSARRMPGDVERPSSHRRRGDDSAPAKRSRSRSPAGIPHKQPRLDASTPAADRLSKVQREELFDREEVLRRAAEARRATDWELRQPALGTGLGIPTLSSRWAPSPGPPGFSRPHERPAARPSSLSMDPSLDREHSMSQHSHLPGDSYDAEEPRKLQRIGAAARTARPLSAAPHAALEDERALLRDRPHSPLRQDSIHCGLSRDRPHSPHMQDFLPGSSLDRPYSLQGQDTFPHALAAPRSAVFETTRSARSWDEPPPWDEHGPRHREWPGRRHSRHEEELPPPPLPPPPPTGSARGSPKAAGSLPLPPPPPPNSSTSRRASLDHSPERRSGDRPRTHHDALPSVRASANPAFHSSSTPAPPSPKTRDSNPPSNPEPPANKRQRTEDPTPSAKPAHADEASHHRAQHQSRVSPSPEHEPSSRRTERGSKQHQQLQSQQQPPVDAIHAHPDGRHPAQGSSGCQRLSRQNHADRHQLRQERSDQDDETSARGMTPRHPSRQGVPGSVSLLHPGSEAANVKGPSSHEQQFPSAASHPRDKQPSGSLPDDSHHIHRNDGHGGADSSKADRKADRHLQSAHGHASAPREKSAKGGAALQRTSKLHGDKQQPDEIPHHSSQDHLNRERRRSRDAGAETDRDQPHAASKTSARRSADRDPDEPAQASELRHGHDKFAIQGSQEIQAGRTTLPPQASRKSSRDGSSSKDRGASPSADRGSSPIAQTKTKSAYLGRDQGSVKPKPGQEKGLDAVAGSKPDHGIKPDELDEGPSSPAPPGFSSKRGSRPPKEGNKVEGNNPRHLQQPADSALQGPAVVTSHSALQQLKASAQPDDGRRSAKTSGNHDEGAQKPAQKPAVRSEQPTAASEMPVSRVTPEQQVLVGTNHAHETASNARKRTREQADLPVSDLQESAPVQALAHGSSNPHADSHANASGRKSTRSTTADSTDPAQRLQHDIPRSTAEAGAAQRNEHGSHRSKVNPSSGKVSGVNAEEPTGTGKGRASNAHGQVKDDMNGGQARSVRGKYDASSEGPGGSERASKAHESQPEMRKPETKGLQPGAGSGGRGTGSHKPSETQAAVHGKNSRQSSKSKAIDAPPQPGACSTIRQSPGSLGLEPPAGKQSNPCGSKTPQLGAQSAAKDGTESVLDATPAAVRKISASKGRGPATLVHSSSQVLEAFHDAQKSSAAKPSGPASSRPTSKNRASSVSAPVSRNYEAAQAAQKPSARPLAPSSSQPASQGKLSSISIQPSVAPPKSSQQPPHIASSQLLHADARQPLPNSFLPPPSPPASPPPLPSDIPPASPNKASSAGKAPIVVPEAHTPQALGDSHALPAPETEPPGIGALHSKASRFSSGPANERRPQTGLLRSSTPASEMASNDPQAVLKSAGGSGSPSAEALTRPLRKPIQWTAPDPGERVRPMSAEAEPLSTEPSSKRRNPQSFSRGKSNNKPSGRGGRYPRHRR